MTGPLDELLASLGARGVLPRPSPDPTFSVIVRTQGARPSSLVAALASIAEQTRPPTETLVMVHADDPTTVGRVRDSLEESASTLPENWKALPVSGGRRGRPLNAGLDEASGDYVTFLDDDDLALPSWIEAFARGTTKSPGAVVRAVCLTQDWATEGTGEPVRALGEVERPFAGRFDLLSHFSHNETPICSVALPRATLDELGIRFDEDLPVFEDWELLVRTVMVAGVVSIPDETSLYRRLDAGNAFSAVDEADWHRTHAAVIERFRSRPVLLPTGVADRLAAAHFEPDGTTEHERRATALSSSPWWRLTAGPRRIVTVLRSGRDRVRRG